MRSIVKVKQVFRNIKNQMLLVENIYTDLDLELDKEYSMEIKEVRSHRTLQQNKYMWALIHEIAHHESMNQSEVEVYTLALEEANANV